jgi:hypothetical protein
VGELPWQATVTRHLNNEEVGKAFDRLIEPRNLGKPRCFCLFIDGLDQLDSAGGQDYGDLVKILRRWTQSIKKDPQICKDIKLCVSSKEENDFMDGFKPLQRLSVSWFLPKAFNKAFSTPRSTTLVRLEGL